MKIEVKCIIDFEDGELGGYEYNEFIGRRIWMFEELIDERFELNSRPIITVRNI